MSKEITNILSDTYKNDFLVMRPMSTINYVIKSVNLNVESAKRDLFQCCLLKMINFIITVCISGVYNRELLSIGILYVKRVYIRAASLIR